MSDADEAREACLLCRVAFSSRLSCASHAARVHGYRRAGTLLANGTTCQGCGKVYSNQGRLRRHINYSVACRQAWGGFCAVAEHEPPHPQKPPAPEAAPAQGRTRNLDDGIHLPLLEALDVVQAVDVGAVLEIVFAHFAPLEVLRNTVRHWQDLQCAGSAAAVTAYQAFALVTPANVADSFKAPSSSWATSSIEVPHWPALGVIAHVSSGPLVTHCVPEPLNADFLFPFTQAVPPSVAASIVEWCRKAADVILHAAQDARQHRIAIHLSSDVRKVVGVAHLWLEQTSLPTVFVSP